MRETHVLTRVDVMSVTAFVCTVLVLVGVGAVMVIVEAVETPLKTVTGAGVSVAKIVEVARRYQSRDRGSNLAKRDKWRSYKLQSAW